MKLKRILVPFAVAACLAAALTACSGDGDGDDDGEDKSSTSSDDNNDKSDSDDNDDSDDSDHEDGAGRVLTAEEVEAALPVESDLGSGWTRDPDNEDDDSDEDDDDEVNPPECRDIFENEALESDQADARGTHAFKQDDFGPFADAEIRTFDDLVEDEALGGLAEALDKCDEFTTTNEDGEESKVTTETVDFPSLGEETLAFTMDVASSVFPLKANFAAIRIGHNMVLLSNFAIGDQAPDIKQLEELAEKTLDKLAG